MVRILIGLGGIVLGVIGTLLTQRYGSDDTKEALEKAKEAVSDAADKVEEAMEDMAEKIEEGAEEITDKVKKTAKKAKLQSRRDVTPTHLVILKKSP